MMLFNTNPTPEPPASLAAKRIVTRMNQAYMDMIRAHQEVFSAFWHTSNASPQEIADALMAMGVTPTSIFQLGAGLVDLIHAAKPGTIPVERYTPPTQVDFNQDGSVTIADS